MKHVIKPALAGIALAVAAPAALVPMVAHAATAPGVAVVNVQAVVANSSAMQTADQQRQTTYKSQIDAANAKRQQLQTQMKPLVDKFNQDRAAASPNQQSLQQQAATLQQMEQNGNRELQQILAPVALSQAYVQEQISDQLPTAIENAAKKKGVTLVISPDNVLYADATYNLNQDVLTELNTLIPSAQLVPPQGWLPRDMREQQAQQQAAAAQAQPAAAGTNQPTSR